jgi:hypothetical protein
MTAAATLVACGQSLVPASTNAPASRQIPAPHLFVLPRQVHSVPFLQYSAPNPLTNAPQLRVPRPRASTNAAPARPKPGVYESVPYSGIIVVPPPHPDDRGILGHLGQHHQISGPTPELAAPMPIIRPELRLIPHPSK